MSKVEVLVATMHQKDFSKYYDMKIKSDVIFANQTDSFFYKETQIDNNKLKLISTNERGVGKNRNIGLLFSKNPICLISDDDLFYVDDYVNIIEEAFDKIKEADVIIFNIVTLGKKTNRRINNRIKRVRYYNFLNYGAVRIAFKRDSIINNNIWFSLKFGGGAAYSAGEDSLFLKQCLDKKLKIFTYPRTIAYVNQENSSWFQGYNDKYFYDKGALLRAAFPKLYSLIIIYYAYKFRKYGLIKNLKLMLEGAKGYRINRVYEEYSS